MEDSNVLLVLEPYFGGSHRQFLEGYQKHSCFSMRLLTLPPRKWKWRMRGSALYWAPNIGRLVPPSSPPRLVFCSDFLDLAAFKGLSGAPWNNLPCVVYFHENQLIYPSRNEEKKDYHFGFTNLTTAACADKVLFNSCFNRDSFLEAASHLLSKMPDYQPTEAVDEIREKSAVVPVGLDLEGMEKLRSSACEREGPVTILWNHRWEHDKDPETFFSVLVQLAEEGLPFRVAVAGQSYGRRPAVFEQAKERLGNRLVHWGYASDKEAYYRLLSRSDMVVSTALHEFFGISVLEAVAMDCFPLLPNRLSYPELLPSQLHERHLYDSRGDLVRRLRYWLKRPKQLRQIRVRHVAARYSWERVAPQLDQALLSLFH